LNNHRINQPTQVIQLAHTWGKIRSDWSDPEIGCCTLHATRTSPRDSPAAYGKQRQCGNNQTSEPKKATYEVTMVVLNGNWQKLYLYLRDTLIYQQLNGVVPSMTIQNTISAEPEMSPRRHIVPDVWDARRKHRQSESAAQETAEILHFTKSPGSRGWGYSFEIMDMGLSNKNWQMGPENRVLTPIFYFSTKMTKYYIWYTLFSNKPIHISYKNGYTSELFPTVSLYWLRNFQFSFPQPIPIRSFSMGQNLVPLLFTSKMLVCYGYSSLWRCYLQVLTRNHIYIYTNQKHDIFMNSHEESVVVDGEI
jgi:hypothetical protein